MRYFRLDEDVLVPGRWHLAMPTSGSGERLLPWTFMSGDRFSGITPLRIPIRQPGSALDFTIAGASAPVVSGRLAEKLAALAGGDVEVLPAKIDGQRDEFFVLNVLRVVKCIDEQRCREVRWSTDPDLPEGYAVVSGLKIDPRRTEGARIFRPWGWQVVVIVSDEVKEAMQAAGATGADFKDVTGPAGL